MKLLSVLCKAVLWICLPFLSYGAKNEPLDFPKDTCSSVASIADFGAKPRFMSTPNPTVSSIKIIRKAVFDEASTELGDRWLKALYSMHVLTRSAVIEGQLLFQQGKAVSLAELAETERLLRQRDYLMDARVGVSNPCESAIDVEVIAQDGWSLIPHLEWGFSGGNDKSGLGLREKNVLGTGVSVEVRSIRNLDRRGRQVEVSTPHLLNTRTQSKLRFEDNNDGKIAGFEIGQPFYSLNASRAWGLSMGSEEARVGLYKLGERFQENATERDYMEVSYGFSKGLIDGRSHRLVFGVEYEELKVWENAVDPIRNSPDINQKTLAPFFEWSSVVDRFLVVQNFDLIGLTEDLATGFAHRFRFGLSSKGLGADADVMLLSADLSNTWLASEKGLMQWRLNGRSRLNLDRGAQEDITLNSHVRWLYKPSPNYGYQAMIRFDLLRNQRRGGALFFGGETGARGFADRLQTGDRRVIFRLDRRVYLEKSFFGLANAGWLVFADVGKAWGMQGINGSISSILANVGLGIRVAPTKAERGKVVHIDLAFPVNHRDDPAVSRYELVFAIKDGF